MLRAAIENGRGMSFLDALEVQKRVIGALMLRDVRTRVGRKFFGLIFIIAQPLSHLLLLMTIFMFLRGPLAPVETNPAVFWATGLLSYILCLYPARMMMRSIVENRPLLTFPVVKPLDLVVARGLVDIVICFWVAVIFGALLLAFDTDIMPLRYGDAIAAILATVYLGFSMGFLSAIAFKLVRAWSIVMMIALMTMYFTCGVFFIPNLLPQMLQNIIWFNPLLHCVEWLRAAYYDGFGYGLLNKTYLTSFATLTLLGGLLLERASRGRILMN